jgi:RNA polymerase sigma-70 factor, ECF subfamily
MDTVPAPVASPEDRRLVEALRAGDERAFAELLRKLSPTMVRVAMNYVPTRAVAEEVVQETWLAVLEGLPRFEGRSSLKTWILRILMNRAMTRGQRERRSVPFSALFDPATDREEPAIDPDRFQGPNGPHPGGWAQPPRRWEDSPERGVLSAETLGQVRQAIEGLPPSQREVITLRDVAGWTSQEVCNTLGITETNQRVLLHRARTKVRAALERYFDDRA